MTLYLKYRPQDFSSLVWQGFIKETLKKAVSEDKTIWAYLFTGPRGTGKTSTARIFAKAINCLNKKEGDPCLECEVCEGFSTNSLIDIIEIDAASHTWVDNIREIIEKAQFQPTKTQYKIYIIDEVHMLSKWAFNALLKILEEPPEHVKFILATTEIHKVPDTILSRCQRYDFKSITDEDIHSRLQFIAKSEKVEVDNESYQYIVKNAEGALRNAISLFEQLIRDHTISFSYITETLGISSDDEIEKFLQKLLEKDSTIMQDFQDLTSSGKNLKYFFKALIHLLRIQAMSDIEWWKNIVKQVELLEILQDILTKLKYSFDEWLTLQIGLLKILSSDQSLPQITETQVQKEQSNQNKKEDSPTLWEEQETKKPEPIIEEPEPKNESLLEETQNLFAQDILNKELWWQKSSGEGFDTEALIREVKSQGAKAALTMSLRGSDISLQEEVLQIKTKTQISLKTIEKTESKEFIHRACQALGFKVESIKVQ